MAQVAAGTIVAKNHLAHARVLADSFLLYHPHIPFFVLLADEADGCFAPERENYRVIRLSELEVPRGQQLCFHYSQQELSYAVAPYFLRFLLDLGFDGAVFLKQESLVLGDLTPVISQLHSHSILLTPHLLGPLGADDAARELTILQSGAYNNGFLGVSGSPTGRQFLDWWQDRLFDHCRHDVGRGMHFEQRWLDLVPAFFEGVHIVRSAGTNVGHWNLPEREVRFKGDDMLVDDEPCRLFRFSGFQPEHPDAVTRYSSRLTMPSIGSAAEVFRRYLTLLEQAGYHESKAWPYAFGCFDNSVPIPELARRMYRNEGASAERFGNPFETAPPGSFFRWLNDPAGEPGTHVTRLWRTVWEDRPDLQQAYPDLLGADREAFLRWSVNFGAHEHRIPVHYLPMLQQADGANG